MNNDQLPKTENEEGSWSVACALLVLYLLVHLLAPDAEEDHFILATLIRVTLAFILVGTALYFIMAP